MQIKIFCLTDISKKDALKKKAKERTERDVQGLTQMWPFIASGNIRGSRGRLMRKVNFKHFILLLRWKGIWNRILPSLPQTCLVHVPLKENLISASLCINYLLNSVSGSKKCLLTESLILLMLFFVFLCRVQTNWKSLRSKALSMDQGKWISQQQQRVSDSLSVWISLKVSFLFIFLVYVARKRRLLQAHLLWDRVPPVHGDYAQPRLCQQVRLLLEVRWRPWSN